MIDKAIDLASIAHVEDEQILGMRTRWNDVFGCGEFQVGAGARQVEHHAAITVMIGESSDLGQPKTIAVERDHVVQTTGLASYPYLHSVDPRRPSEHVHDAL